MTDFVSVPLPTVIYDYDVHWPSSGTLMGVGSAPSLIAETRDGAQIAAWLASAGGAGTFNVSLMGTTQGLCQQLVSTGVNQRQISNDGYNAYVPLAAGGAPAGLLYPTVWRIFRWQILFQLAAAANSGKDCNIVIQPESGVRAGPFSSGGNNTGVGIAGSAATPGTWRYVSRVVAGPGITETVELGISQTVPTLADFVILAANGGGAAVFQLFTNGDYSAPKVQRTFGGGLLPNYADPLNATHFKLAYEQSDNANPGTLQVGYIRAMQGHFTPQGSAI